MIPWLRVKHITTEPSGIPLHRRYSKVSKSWKWIKFGWYFKSHPTCRLPNSSPPVIYFLFPDLVHTWTPHDTVHNFRHIFLRNHSWHALGKALQIVGSYTSITEFRAVSHLLLCPDWAHFLTLHRRNRSDGVCPDIYVSSQWHSCRLNCHNINKLVPSLCCLCWTSAVEVKFYTDEWSFSFIG